MKEKHNGKKVLVLGATGAMGTYLVPELAAIGYKVDAVSLDEVKSDNPDIAYYKADAKDITYLRELLKNKYDAIFDFMIYSTKEFCNRYEIFLDGTKHYFFLSTYRVYADAAPITENSPRLLDTATNKDYLADAENEYSLYKALQENILQESAYKNWTILRPVITFSKRRFQLVTLEADTIIYRARRKLPVILPQDALSAQGTMIWACDVAKMLSRLILNSTVYRETYTVATSEHHTWKEIAEIYKELIGLEYIAVDNEVYLDFFGPIAAVKYAKYQLIYDRCVDRIVDNSKILKATGLMQMELTPLKEGLNRELFALPPDAFSQEKEISRRMDGFLRRNL